MCLVTHDMIGIIDYNCDGRLAVCVSHTTAVVYSLYTADLLS